MKILFAEDQTMVRNALANLLRLQDDTQVIEAENGQMAIEQLKAQAFDLVLTDIEMPEISGIELTQWVKQYQPQTPVVVITTFNRSGYIQRVLDAGAKGFLLKDAPVEELLQALRSVLAGQRVINNELLLQALGNRDPLSEKERKALKLASDGLTTSKIAATLFVAEDTARNILSNAISKLHAENRIDAARIAHQNGWL
ncbi:DNA-binding response regulator [Idiomarina tyrosinivorans]|uniref:DNA-binding response regulator n=1 Tax=Idiomarina tyrosinivorans TaxID=1445662 RepID=A0A432ZR35_9GAMM|nr:response regulator transcription factor [Idiomarina tyrosinivorans]RUO80370.1 DNA-binding response regulator [Idiomarina tyrosinivorans]